MKSIPEHYDSLDMPVYYWQRVHESNDYSWLLKKRKKVNAKLLALLENVWENIYDSYLKEFGFSENFIEIKEKEIEIAKLQIEMILTGNRVLQTWIDIAKLELDDLRKSIGKADFMSSKIAIESRFKFQINMMTTSVLEFYSYIKHLK